VHDFDHGRQHWSKDVTLARPSKTAGDWFLVDLRPLRGADLEALTPKEITQGRLRRPKR
jgi:hypothetical protein